MKRLSFILLLTLASLFASAQTTEFPVPDQKATFPGGAAEMQAFILDNIYYPARCSDFRIQGKVLVRFVVDKDGKIVNPEIESSPNEELSREALRVVSKMPDWIPARLKGKPIKSRFMLPVTFKLNDVSVAIDKDVEEVMAELNMKSAGCTEEPRGLYRLAAMSFDNGKPSQAMPYAQYKLCTDNIDIQIEISNDDETETAFHFYNNDSQKLRYTGDVEVACDPSKHDGHGTRIFDSNKYAFKLKWYNVERISASVFPLNHYTTEWYDGDESKMPKSLIRAISLMKDTPAPSADNRFIGSWHCEGVRDENENESEDQYVIYDKDVYVSLRDISRRAKKLYGVVFFRPIVYNEDGSILEYPSDGPQQIEWIDNNTFHKSYLDHTGNKLTEVWTRQPLPENYQNVFKENK